MPCFKLLDIRVLEMDTATGLRNKEHRVYSLFEADRLLESIRDQNAQPELLELQFQLNYSEDGKPRVYSGQYRYGRQTGPLSLQRHILGFFERFEGQHERLKLSAEAFARLKANMESLFEACVTEQMFSLNRPVKIS